MLRLCDSAAYLGDGGMEHISSVALIFGRMMLGAQTCVANGVTKILFVSAALTHGMHYRCYMTLN